MVLEALAIGVPLGTGLFLVAFSCPRLFADRALEEARRYLKGIHLRALNRLAGIRALALPGIHLITSVRGVAAAELILAFGIGAAAFSGLPPRDALRIVAAAAVAAVLWLYLFLAGEGRRQLGKLRDALPSAAFLHSLLIDSGMGHHAALGKVARSLPAGPLAAQLEELARARSLGVPREQAIARARSSVPLPDYHVFLDLLGQGERLGTGLSQGLRELSQRMLEERANRAEAAAQKAAVKMLFPLVVFIFPSVFLVILSPIILSLLAMLGC